MRKKIFVLINCLLLLGGMFYLYRVIKDYYVSLDHYNRITNPNYTTLNKWLTQKDSKYNFSFEYSYCLTPQPNNSSGYTKYIFTGTCEDVGLITLEIQVNGLENSYQSFSEIVGAPSNATISGFKSSASNGTLKILKDPTKNLEGQLIEFNRPDSADESKINKYTIFYSYPADQELPTILTYNLLRSFDFQ